MIEITIKNKWSIDFNLDILKKAIEAAKIDFDKVIKVIITNKIINFVI
jgi:hypothetical protein